MTEQVLIGECYTCHDTMMACPDCVNTIRVDPVTGIPPDVMPDRRTHNPSPDPEAVSRSIQHMLCDSCIKVANDRGQNPPLVPWRERHAAIHQ